MSKYSMISIYKKKENLNDFLYTNKIAREQFKGKLTLETKTYYGKEREIELIAKFRFENNKTFCKINCPINPLPVKGEFEVVSISVLNCFLRANGWERQESLFSDMFE